LLYCGTDDGLVQVSKNSGGSWTQASTSLPKDLWVSRIVASSHKKERVYATLNGYRWDDFTPYVYISDNYGSDWKNISGNLPASPVNVIKEDPVNENVLYLGTDNGAYVSFNRGESWEVFSNSLPNVAVHDLVIQANAKDLVLGTHGRSLYVADISLLQLINTSNVNGLVVAKIPTVDDSLRWGNSWSHWGKVFEPFVIIQFFSLHGGMTTISVETETGKQLQQFSLNATNGVHVFNYDLTISEKGIKNMEKAGLKVTKGKNGKTYLPKGSYTVLINLNGKTVKIPLILD
jgi:hypothetical protein